MLRTGSDYLEALRDGRRIYVGSELVRDVTSHPAFRNTAGSFSTIYLRKRSETHRRVAEWSYGLLGRSPDHVASFIVGLALHPELFEANRKGFGDHLQAYYDELRRRDLFACYVVAAPQTSRNPELYNRQGR